LKVPAGWSAAVDEEAKRCPHNFECRFQWLSVRCLGDLAGEECAAVERGGHAVRFIFKVAVPEEQAPILKEGDDSSCDLLVAVGSAPS
jgi:hypothetical protein